MNEKSSPYAVIWLFATVLAAVPALHLISAALVDGNYIPVGNDSFYHARRIIDAAIGDRGLYQFDHMIHVPDGSWLNWPWAYDGLLAMLLSAALWISPSLDPMTFLAYVPVAWLAVNLALLTLIAKEVGLRPIYTTIALAGFALLPLTQTLHGIGIIDHHFIELTFVLATLWAGLRFFAAASDANKAIVFGIVLGIAPAFHNGLFILQIPVAATFLVLWFRDQYPETQLGNRFSLALFLSTGVVSLFSAPFRDLQFEFWTLSWFHLYIAACTAIAIALMALYKFNQRNGLILGAVCVVMLLPLAARLATGAAFLSGELILLEHILEVKSPLARITETGGLRWVVSYYSWLFFAAPVLLIVFGQRLKAGGAPSSQFFAVFLIVGTLLMLTQYRLHPFGAWALLIGSLLEVQRWQDKRELAGFATAGVTLMAVALAFQAPIANRLFADYPPGFSRDYAATRTLFHSMADACRERSAAALSYNDDGHYIRYHTDCSVLSNNFLMTPLHEEKILEADRYLQLDPEQLLVAAPHIEYVFVRMYEIFEPGPDGRMQPTPIPALVGRNAPLFVALTFAEALPAEYELIDELRVIDERDFAYARVFRINR